MTARSCVFQIYQPNFSEWKASSSLISDCFFCVCFFLSQLGQSDQRLFLLSSGCSNLSLLPIFSNFSLFVLEGEFSLNLRASLVKKNVEKDCVSLMVICGPQKFQMSPQKIRRGSNMALKITDLGTTLSLHGRMYYLPKFEAYIKRWDPQFQ